MASGEAHVLAREIEAVHRGEWDGPALLAAFRDSLVWLPTAGANSILTGERGGVCWVYAFSGETELAAFRSARGADDQEWLYLTVRGRRVLDTVLPQIGRPAGVALDVAGTRPILLPPTPGVVPDEIAVTEAAS